MAPAANKGISNNNNPDMMVLVTRNKGTGRTIPNNPNDKTKGAKNHGNLIKILEPKKDK